MKVNEWIERNMIIMHCFILSVRQKSLWMKCLVYPIVVHIQVNILSSDLNHIISDFLVSISAYSMVS